MYNSYWLPLYSVQVLKDSTVTADLTSCIHSSRQSTNLIPLCLLTSSHQINQPYLNEPCKGDTHQIVMGVSDKGIKMVIWHWVQKGFSKKQPLTSTSLSRKQGWAFSTTNVGEQEHDHLTQFGVIINDFPEKATFDYCYYMQPSNPVSCNSMGSDCSTQQLDRDSWFGPLEVQIVSSMVCMLSPTSSCFKQGSQGCPTLCPTIFGHPSGAMYGLILFIRLFRIDIKISIVHLKDIANTVWCHQGSLPLHHMSISNDEMNDDHVTVASLITNYMVMREATVLARMLGTRPWH